MEALRLIASQRFAEKRIGYLALMLLLDENQELLMLGTNSIQNDLRNRRAPHVIGLALITLGTIASRDMARDLAGDVANLMKATSTFVEVELRNKACLCAIRLIRKVPELIEDFVPLMQPLLTCSPHAVPLAACTLMIEMCKLNPEATLPAFRRAVPQLVQLLRSLWMAGYVAEYDVVGVTDPFLQCKILQLLRYLGTGDERASAQMGEVLAQVVINTDSSTNTGTAVLYECVQTIMSVESEGGLRVLAVNLLGKFLTKKDNNIRYVALNTLCKAVDRYSAVVNAYRNTVVDCLKDLDVSIRRRALELVYALVTKTNVRVLVKELLNYLALTTGDQDFKAELTEKICLVVEKFAPSRRWHIQTMITVLASAGPFIRETGPVDLIALITRCKELQPFAVHLLLRQLRSAHARDQHALAAVAVWAVGELGEHLVSDKSLAQANEDLAQSNAQAAEAQEPPQEPFAAVTEADVLAALEYQMTTNTFVHAMLVTATPTALAGAGTPQAPGGGVSGISAEVVKQMTQTALLKLFHRFGSGKAAGKEAAYAKIRAMLAHHATAASAELQQRSVEYGELAKPDHAEILTYVLSRMPQFTRARKAEEEAFDAAKTVADAQVQQQQQQQQQLQQQQQQPAPVTPPAEAEQKATPPAVVTAAAAAPPATASGGQIDLLSGLFDTTPAAPVVSVAAAPVAAAAAPNVFDLLSAPVPQQQPQQALYTPSHSGPATASATPAMSPAASFDVFSFGAAAAVSPSSTASAPAGVETHPPRTVLDSRGLKIVFTETRQAATPNVVSVAIAFHNETGAEMRDFDLLVAVPPHVKRDLKAASSKTIPPHSAGAVTQHLTLTNEQFPDKATLIKIKVTYNANGEAVTEQGSIRDFPGARA
jgi:AP-1 complex subunit gamma-1